MNYTKLWCLGKKYIADPIRRLINKIILADRVPLFWFPGSNWGDALNPVLVGIISGRLVKQTTADYCDRYLVIGSVLRNAYNRTTVWGSGFMSDGETVQQPPKAINAVRGPLTRATLLNAGIKCPEVYGDPALLLPLFYYPKIEIRYKIGIIPHYVDKNHPWIDKQRLNPRVLIIDIEEDITSVIHSVMSCQNIFSSSLHGLICSDAYGIPSSWIQLSDNVSGGEFKFNDYFLSIKKSELQSTRVDINTELNELLLTANKNNINLDLRELLLACPFISLKLRSAVESMTAADVATPNSLAEYWTLPLINY